jgi:hypothetical protein
MGWYTSIFLSITLPIVIYYIYNIFFSSKKRTKDDKPKSYSDSNKLYRDDDVLSDKKLHKKLVRKILQSVTWLDVLRRKAQNKLIGKKRSLANADGKIT